jgi:hypothetical protein
MSGPASLSNPYVQHLSLLLEEISKGHIQIPKFQRRFLWTDEKRLELLRSIYDGIPIGSILLWRTNLKSIGSAMQLGPHELPPPRAAHATERTYLLDGMQRLSTLYGCLWPLPRGRSPFIEDEEGERQSWLVCYDLEKKDFVKSDDEQIPPVWLPLTALLDSVRLLQFQRKLMARADADLLIKRADVLAEAFRGYVLPIIPINTDNLADATRTFQRINSQGTRMSELHMVRALTWDDGFDLEEELERAASLLEDEGWESLDPELILQACKAALGIDISVGAPDELSRSIKKKTKIIAQVTESLVRLSRWMRQRKIPSHRLVPYSAQIVLLADVFRLEKQPSKDISQKLWRWLWQTTYSGYFASISGYRMSALLEGVRSVARGGEMVWPGGKSPVPKFDLQPRFDARAARIKAAALWLARLNPLGEHQKPVGALSQLAGRGPSCMVHIVPPSSGVPGTSSIANRTFISPGSNLIHLLCEKTSSLDQKILESHLILPKAAAALKKKDYERFLQYRKSDIEDYERKRFESLFAD